MVTLDNDISSVASPYATPIDELTIVREQTVSWDEKQAEREVRLTSTPSAPSSGSAA